MDGIYFRVQAKMLFTNQGIATGLYTHFQNQLPKVSIINKGQINEERPFVRITNLLVEADLPFPLEYENDAEGSFNHAKNQIDQTIAISDEEKSYCQWQRCLHEINDECLVLERVESS